MFKILLAITLIIGANAKDFLYLQIPSDLPSKKVTTPFGLELLKLINNAQDEICFAIYGLRGQDRILNVLLKAQKRGVDIKGIVDTD